MKLYKTILIILLISFLNVKIIGQFGFNQQEIIQIEFFKSFERVHAGGEVKFALKANILEEWHINSNNPNEDFLIPTDLIISSQDEMEFGDMIYPKSHEIKFDFSDVPVSVYEGEVYIGTKIKIPKDIDLGKKEIFIDFTLFVNSINFKM